jgi:hypothetical protein
MGDHKVGTREQHQAARDALLKRENDQTIIAATDCRGATRKPAGGRDASRGSGPVASLGANRVKAGVRCACRRRSARQGGRHEGGHRSFSVSPGRSTPAKAYTCLSL